MNAVPTAQHPLSLPDHPRPEHPPLSSTGKPNNPIINWAVEFRVEELGIMFSFVIVPILHPFLCQGRWLKGDLFLLGSSPSASASQFLLLGSNNHGQDRFCALPASLHSSTRGSTSHPPRTWDLNSGCNNNGLEAFGLSGKQHSGEREQGAEEGRA